MNLDRVENHLTGKLWRGDYMDCPAKMEKAKRLLRKLSAKSAKEIIEDESIGHVVIRRDGVSARRDERADNRLLDGGHMTDRRDLVDAANRQRERTFKKLLFRCKCHI